MIQKVRNSGIMDNDMKVSIKMASYMAKVNKQVIYFIIYWF